MGKQKYPTELRLKVTGEYKEDIFGYKKLARKYNLKRDLVRYWVLTDKKKASEDF